MRIFVTVIITTKAVIAVSIGIGIVLVEVIALWVEVREAWVEVIVVNSVRDGIIVK